MPVRSAICMGMCRPAFCGPDPRIAFSSRCECSLQLRRPTRRNASPPAQRDARKATWVIGSGSLLSRASGTPTHLLRGATRRLSIKQSRTRMSDQISGAGQQTLPPSPYQIQVSYGAEPRASRAAPAPIGSARSIRCADRAAGHRRPPLRLSAPATTSSPVRVPTSRSVFTSCALLPTPTISCAWSSRRARTRWNASAGASGRVRGR